MKYLVTRAAGSIDSNIVKQLSDQESIFVFLTLLQLVKDKIVESKNNPNF